MSPLTHQCRTLVLDYYLNLLWQRRCYHHILGHVGQFDRHNDFGLERLVHCLQQPEAKRQADEEQENNEIATTRPKEIFTDV